MSILDVLTSKKTGASESEEAPKATDLLKKDHDTVKALFKEFRGLDDHDQQEKRRLFTEIDRELTVHATIEEEIFYPAVTSGTTEEGEELVLEANEEHAIVKTLLSQIRSLAQGDPRFDAKMKVLMEGVEHHAGEEESELFDEAKTLGSDKLKQLGGRMQQRKMQLMSGGKGALEPSRASRRGSSSRGKSAKSTSKSTSTRTSSRRGKSPAKSAGKRQTVPSR